MLARDAKFVSNLINFFFKLIECKMYKKCKMSDDLFLSFDKKIFSSP